MQFYDNFVLLGVYDTDKRMLHLTNHTFIYEICTEMIFNLAQVYPQFLSRLCIKYNKYLQYILNDFCEFNGCFTGRR